MKKFLPYIIIAGVVLIGVVTYGIIQSQSNNGTAEQAGNSATANNASSSAKKYTDACKMFTSEQLGSALGGTYGAGEEDIAPTTATPGTDDYEDLQGTACSWDQTHDGTTDGMTKALDVSLAVSNFKDSAAAKAYVNQLHSPQTAEGQASVNAPIDVDGVGDQAFFVKLKTAQGVDEKNTMLYVLMGRQVIAMTATRLAGVDQAGVQAGLTELAKQL